MTQAKTSNQTNPRHSGITGYDLRRKARTGLSSARRQATTPRLAAAAALGAVAAAAGYLADAGRRERLGKSAQDLRDRWSGTSHQAVTADGIGAAPGA